MIIENPDIFKSWLTSILEPLCDADPAALAKYVYALVKKDKPVEELREVMVDQLDVFLQQETKPFVEMLFKSLETHDYLKPREVECPKVPTPPPSLPSLQPEPEKEPEVEVNNHVPMRPASPTAGAALAPRHRVVVARAPPKLAAPAPAPLPPAVAPRPPHMEQTLVKVLPLTELLEEPVDQPPRRRDRRNDSLRGGEDRRRRRSRSSDRRGRTGAGAPGGGGAPRRHHYEDRRRATSRSPPGRYRNRSPPPPPSIGVDRQASRSRSRSPVPRDRDHERERDRVRVTREMDRDRMSRDRDHRDRLSRSRDRERSRDRDRSRSTSPRVEHADSYRRRCRDFDEKGYCMRGDLCQWDHGLDPVVLEDASVLAPHPPPVPEYNPLAPDIWMGGAFGFPPPHPHPHPHPLHPHQHPPRELIPIPRVRHEPPPLGPLNPLPPRHPPPLKKNFDYNRIGTSTTRPVMPPLPAHAANCSLEVKKVPRGLNDIMHLNNHFSKFGKIVNIQVSHEGDPEAALITFSTPAEANVAIKSTEAVLNNRFIKVFWHNPDNKQENNPPSNQQATKPERPNSQHPMSHNKVLINKDNINKQQTLQQQLNDNKEKEKEQSNGETIKKAEVKPQPVDKNQRVIEMNKRAQDLLQTQLHQQRLLIQRLESGNVTGPQKVALMEAINSSQEGIEKLRKELVAYNGTIKQLQKRPKTKDEAKKEILDAEMDLIKKQHEGQDVTELAKKISEMRRQLAIQFPEHPPVRRPHSSRGGRFNTATRYTRGGINKVYSVNQSVDHRPRALLISGFETDELETLYKHFSQFGEVSSKEVDLAVPQLVLQYKARAHAEQAMLHGRNYNDRTLSITWVTNTKASNPSTPGASERLQTTQNGDENKEESLPPIEDPLLRFEEEDEDEVEDRSWRR